MSAIAIPFPSIMDAISDVISRVRLACSAFMKEIRKPKQVEEKVEKAPKALVEDFYNRMERKIVSHINTSRLELNELLDRADRTASYYQNAPKECHDLVKGEARMIADALKGLYGDHI
jgi:hypothetical protein